MNENIELFANWLRPYTREVINKVMIRFDEIVNNDTAIHLLRELKEREDKEFKDFTYSIDSLASHYYDFEEYDPHNHPLTHATSYRDILYDMFIK